METQRPDHEQPWRLLEYPREIRDQIYAEVLLNFPRPSLECLLDRAVCEVRAIESDIGEELVYFEEDDDSAQEGNHAPEFHTEAMNICRQPHQIDTNILLVNRQTFAEAREIILRRGRFVSVICDNIDICRRLSGTELCLIDAKYSSLSMMTYHLDDYSTEPMHSPPGLEFVLPGRDVDNFCRMVMGDTALILRPSLGPETRHTLEFTNNFHDEEGAPEFLTRPEIHEDILKPFRRRLRGFHSISVRGRYCVGVAGALASTTVQDITSRFIPDPDETLSDIRSLHWLCNVWRQKQSYYHTIYPIFKAIDLCKRAVRNSEMWAAMQSKASDPTAFVERLLEIGYRTLVAQLFTWVTFPNQLSPHAHHTAHFRQTYEMCLAAATSFGAPDWSPPTSQEYRTNVCVSQGIYRYRNICPTGMPLAVGYKAAHRAFEITPGRDRAKKLMKLYEGWKKTAVRSGTFIKIEDDVLKQNGVAWWSGSRPWSDI